MAERGVATGRLATGGAAVGRMAAQGVAAATARRAAQGDDGAGREGPDGERTGGERTGGAEAAALWARACQALRTRVGVGRFQSWIAPLGLVGVGGGVATLSVPTAFLGSYVARTFEADILAALAQAGAPVERLAFAPAARPAAAPLPAPAAAPAPAAPVPAAAALPEEAAGRLDPRLTFDRFVAGPSNALALAAARKVATGGAAGFNPLVICGGVGLGKTHLLQAVAHAMRARDASARVLYLSAEQFMFRFVSALRERRAMDFKALFRAVDVLLVDDIQFIAGKDSTQEEFLHTFNALVDGGGRIVLSADRPPSEIPGLEDRLASRLQAGLVVPVQPADHDLRLAVLRQRLAAAAAADPDLRVAEGVPEFLAARIASNLRVVEGALTRLVAQAALVRREVTLDLARDCLGDILRQAERRVSVEEIQRRVAEHYGIRQADLVGPKRLRSFARPRQVAMYLAKTMTSRSLPDLGRRFGGRDHTTIMHGVRRIEELRREDPQIADDVECLRRALLA